MAKILVVDDDTDLELLIKQKFQQKIQENTSEFVFAVNGMDALFHLSEYHDADIVHNDIGSVTFSRLDYTVIGDKVNTAQRLQSACFTGADHQSAHLMKRSKFVSLPESRGGEFEK